MNAIIINDCTDDNAKGRLVTRTSSLLNCQVSFIGIKSELEAAGNLIDALDSLEHCKGVILVNVAPRAGKGKNFSNGTPFGYFWYKEILIISTIDGLTLSLVKKLKLTESIHIIDLDKSLPFLEEDKLISKEEAKRIKDTQFRSFEFQPKAATYLLKHKSLPGNKISIDTINDAPNVIWWVDNFGNCKTTVLTEELKNRRTEEQKNKRNEKQIYTNLGKIKYCERLKDIPNGEIAIITGSSGINNTRFLEIVIQRKSAENELNLKVGDEIKLL